MFCGEAGWGEMCFMSTEDLFILACRVQAHVCCVDGGGGGNGLCVSVHVDACVCARTGRLSLVWGDGPSRVPVSCVTGSSVLYNPNTLRNLVAASLVWGEVAFLL